MRFLKNGNRSIRYKLPPLRIRGGQGELDLPLIAKMNHQYNKKTLKSFRRALRSNPTPHEQMLWSRIRNRQFEGYRFLRQYSIGNYILDFYCPELRIGIELDGSQHLESNHQLNDMHRTEFLERNNVHVVRYYNSNIDDNFDGVLEDLFQKIHEIKNNPSQPPLMTKGRGII